MTLITRQIPWDGSPGLEELFFLAGGLIQFFSRQQDCTALSTGEAEYIALSETCKDIKCFRQLLPQAGIDCDGATVVRCDNNPAITWTEPLSTKFPKHIDVRYNFVRDLVEQDDVKIVYTSSESNIADIFTKPLPIDAHRRHCDAIGLKVWEEC